MDVLTRSLACATLLVSTLTSALDRPPAWAATQIEEFATGALGQQHALQLDGQTAYAEAAAAPDLNLTGDWTVEAWFKDEDPNGFDHDFRQILMKGDRDASPEAPYYLLVGRKSILAGVRTGGQDYPIVWDLTFAGLDPNAWHQVAVTFRADLNVLNLWLDGTHISYLTVPAHSQLGNTLPLEIGRNGPATGKYWLGQLRDVRVWRIARSGRDISASYLTTVTGNEPGLVAAWPFDEADGTAAQSITGGSPATLHGGARFVPIPPGCGPGRPACPDLQVTQAHDQITLDAAPERTLTLQAVVSNAPQLTGPANVPAGARLLEEELPRVLGAAVDPAEEACWDHPQIQGTCSVPSVENFNSARFGALGRGVGPGLPVNTVRYLGYRAPAGYACTPAAPGVTIVSCAATRRDQIRPGEQRVFSFTISLFDTNHPYLPVDDTAIGSGQPLTAQATDQTVVDPDHTVPELTTGHKRSRATVTIHAPLIQVVSPLATDCLLSNTSRSTVTKPDGTVVSVGTFTCSLRLSTAQSSAPAVLPAGALHLAVHADQLFPLRVEPGGAAVGSVEVSCGTSVSPAGGASGAVACTSSDTSRVPGPVGLWDGACTTPSTLTLAPGSEVTCRMVVTATVPGTPLLFGFNACFDPTSGCTNNSNGVDMAPLTFTLSPEIIRFASPSLAVKAQYDASGGGVDF